MHPETVIDIFLLPLGAFLLWTVFRPRVLMRRHGAAALSRVSIIVPARNEAHRIGRLLESLQKQSVTPYELIVVDDDSTDDTVSKVGIHASVVRSEPLPAEWSGKCWACWQGALRSSGDLLLFLDADTWLEPKGLERILNLYEGKGLFSLQPYHAACRPYEQLSAFFNLVLLSAVGVFTPLGKLLRPGGAFGPCMMFRRDEYFATGGHSAVKNAGLEDIALGHLFQNRALPVRCDLGSGIISFRMYPGGFKELLEGWSKGMASGAVSVHPAFSLLTTAWIVGCFGTARHLIGSLFSQSVPLFAVNLALYAGYAALTGHILSRIGRFKAWTWLAYPVPLSFFALVMIRSLVSMVLLRRVTWKGRTMPVTRRGRQTTGEM